MFQDKICAALNDRRPIGNEFTKCEHGFPKALRVEFC